MGLLYAICWYILALRLKIAQHPTLQNLAISNQNNYILFPLFTSLTFLFQLVSLIELPSLFLTGTIFFDSFSLIQSLLLSHPSLCGSVPITQIIQCGPGGVGRWCHDVASGRGNVGLFPLCLSLISLPLNQAPMGLMVWWRSWFDVADSRWCCG